MFRVNYYYKLDESDKKYTWSKIVKDKKLQKVPLSEERDNYGVSKSVTRNTKRYQGPIEWHWDENNVSLQTTTSLEFHSHLGTWLSPIRYATVWELGLKIIKNCFPKGYVRWMFVTVSLSYTRV